MNQTERIMAAVRKVMVKNSSVFGLDTYIEIAFELEVDISEIVGECELVETIECEFSTGCGTVFTTSDSFDTLMGRYCQFCGKKYVHTYKAVHQPQEVKQ